MATRRASTDTLRYLSSAIAGRPTPCLARKTPMINAIPRGTRRQNPHTSPFSTSTRIQQQTPSPQESASQSTTPTPSPSSSTTALPTDTATLSRKTHYDLFPSTLPTGPPPHSPFEIDTRLLRREFLRLQALAHPDRHPHDASGQKFAQTLSARINEAYRTLSDPLARAQYLLSLRGADGAVGEAAQLGEGEGDQELLLEVLELREEIDEVEGEEDVERMIGENEKRVRESVRVLGEVFARDDLQAAAREAVRLRYWVNIQDSLRAWEKGKPVVLEH